MKSLRLLFCAICAISVFYSCKKETPTLESGIYSFTFDVYPGMWSSVYTNGLRSGVSYTYSNITNKMPQDVLKNGVILVYLTDNNNPYQTPLPFIYTTSSNNGIPNYVHITYILTDSALEIAVYYSVFPTTVSPTGLSTFRVVGITNQTLLQKNLSVDKLRDYNTAVQALGLNTQM